MKRVSVASIVIPSAALVVGLVLGGWGPRSENQQLRDKLFALERDQARTSNPVVKGLNELIAPDLSRREASPQLSRPADAAAIDAPAPVQHDKVSAPERSSEPSASPEAPPIEEPRTPETIRKALDTRAAAARSALIDATNPTDEQLDQIDAAYADMNDALLTITDDFLRQNGDAALGRREAMVLAADALDELISAEDRVRAVLSDEQRASLTGELTDPTAFVDGRLADALTGLGELEH